MIEVDRGLERVGHGGGAGGQLGNGDPELFLGPADALEPDLDEFPGLERVDEGLGGAEPVLGPLVLEPGGRLGPLGAGGGDVLAAPEPGEQVVRSVGAEVEAGAADPAGQHFAGDGIDPRGAVGKAGVPVGRGPEVREETRVGGADADSPVANRALGLDHLGVDGLGAAEGLGQGDCPRLSGQGSGQGADRGEGPGGGAFESHGQKYRRPDRGLRVRRSAYGMLTCTKRMHRYGARRGSGGAGGGGKNPWAAAWASSSTRLWAPRRVIAIRR